MAEPVKYKFGDSEIDLKTYLHNINQNVNGFVESRVKKYGWNESQVQEFQNAFNRYVTALQDQLDNNTNRFSTDAFGTIRDTQGEFNDTDSDDFYYNDKGERITGEEFNSLKKRKQNKYTDFKAIPHLVNYLKLVGQNVVKHTINAPQTSASYDKAKHGWDWWWGNYQNPNGGEDLSAYVEQDTVVDGKRPVSKRALLGADFIDSYTKWLKDKNLDYSNNALTGEDIQTRLANLSAKWRDGNWNQEDKIAAQQAGISQNWLDTFFSEEENYKMTAEQRAAAKAKAEKDAKDASDKESAEQAEAKRRAWIDSHRKNWDLYKQGAYTDENGSWGFGVGFLPLYKDITELNASFKEGTPEYEKYIKRVDGKPNLDEETYIKDFYANPFRNQQHTRNALYLILNEGMGNVHKMDDTRYYLQQNDDRAKGRGLIYDAGKNSIYYTFIGNIPIIWDAMKKEYEASQDPNYIYKTYQQGGELPKFQYGGYIDYEALAKKSREAAYTERGKSKGRSAEQQQAAEREVGNFASEGHLFNDAKDTGANDNGWQSEDYARVGGAIADIFSMLAAFVPGYGTVTSAGLGFGSTLANLYADYKDKSVSTGQMFKNLGINAGLDFIGLIPGGNMASTAEKVTKNLLKYVPYVMGAIGTTSALANADGIKISLNKLAHNDTLTVEDWQNVSQAFSVVFGIGTAAARKGTQKWGGDKYNKVLDRRPATTVQDKVAVEFVNPTTKEKQLRVFTNDDAKAIREAQASGDASKLKEVTIDKFQELRGLELSTGISTARLRWIHGDNGFQSPIGTTLGAPRIYDIQVGPNGKTFINRGKWTGDVSIHDARNAGMTREAYEDAQILGKDNVQRAVQGSQRMEALVGRKDAEVTRLTADKQAAEQALEAHYTATGDRRSVAELNAELETIRRRRGASDVDYTAKEAELTQLGNDFNATKTSTKARRARLQQEINRSQSEISRLNNEMRTIESNINTYRAQLSTASAPAAQRALIDRISIERNNLKAKQAELKQHQQKIGELQTKRKEATKKVDDLHTKYGEVKQWLDDNSTTTIGNLTTQRDATQVLQRPIDHLAAQLNSWSLINPNTLQSNGTKKLIAEAGPDGKIEFKLDDGSVVHRTFQQLKDKYGIKYKRGGQIPFYQAGTGKNGITDTKPKNNNTNLNWYNDVLHNTNGGQSLYDWLTTTNFDDAGIEEFNNLQKSWYANKSNTHYDGTQAIKDTSGEVRKRQQLWNEKGYNSFVSGLVTGKGTDNDANGFAPDNIFGNLENMRHFGDENSWKNNPAEYIKLRSFLNAKGLDYAYDKDSGMYLLSKFTKPTIKSTIPEPSFRRTQGSVGTKSNIGTQNITESHGSTETDREKNSDGTNSNGTENPKFDTLRYKYSIPRLILANNEVEDVGALEQKALSIVDLENPFTYSRYIQSDLDEEQRGKRSKAELLHLASRPLTSDGALYAAMQSDAAIKGLEFENSSMAKSNLVAQQSAELARQATLESAKNVHQASENNYATLNEAQRAKLRQLQIKKKGIFDNIDTYLQSQEFAEKQEASQLKALAEQYDAADAHDLVLQDPKKYAQLNDEEYAAYNKVLEGTTTYTGLSKEEQKLYDTAAHKISLAERNMMRERLGVPSRYGNVRAMTTNTKEENNESWNIFSPALKDGGKAQILRNRSKDQDRFHRNIQKQKDRSERAYDRCAKYSKRKKK